MEIDQIVDYLHYLAIERGLSLNTRISYERDLNHYFDFLTAKQISDWNEVERYTIVDFMQKLQEEGLATTSITRMISTLRRFHQFLRQERYTEHDQFSVRYLYSYTL